MSTIKINTCDKEWFGKDYVFYDSSGNPININYDEELDIYQGRQYFPENGSDTFKELEINIFERIRGFEYQQYNIGTGSTTSELHTRKFQLFNTEGIKLLGNSNTSEVNKIEAVNNDPNFNSKWIYGDDIDLLFPYGTEIKFNRSIFSINNNNTYTVVGSKQGAILIITSDDNKSFIDNIGGSINDESNYNGLKIEGTNVIKIQNYIDGNYRNNLPYWSEPNFYNQIFNEQKLSLVNSEKNDGVYSIKNKNVGDNYYNNFKLLVDDLDGDLNIKLINKTSNFRVMSCDVIFNNSDKSMEIINGKVISNLLKPNTDFRIPLSISNDKILTIEEVPLFNNQEVTYYSDGGTSSRPDQVFYNNRIYECIQSYTQSSLSNSSKNELSISELSVSKSKKINDKYISLDNIDAEIDDTEDPTTYSAITPENQDYWKLTNFVYLKQNIINETLYNIDIFLNSNQLNLYYEYDNSLSPRVNLAKCFESYRTDLESVGTKPHIDPLGYYGTIESIYPSYYIDVEFYIDKVDTFTGSTNSTTGNNSPTGYKFSYDPHETTDLNVYLDGNKILISEDSGTSGSFAYFSDDGGTNSVDFESLSTNSELCWNGYNANFGLSPTNSITIEYTTEVSIRENVIERVIEVNEPIISEINSNISVRPERRIVITDIDDFGLRITINGESYDIESTLIYRNNGQLDMEESIDATVKKWVQRWKIDLDRLGIIITSENFSLNNTTVLHNSLLIKGIYSNIEIDIEVSVGDTADFIFPDKYITFHQLGGTASILSIQINGKNYTQPYTSSVETTLSNWINEYSTLLHSYGIYVEQFNQSLLFSKIIDLDINVNINVGKLFYPGEKVVEILEYWKGNQGFLISSNSIIQPNNEISFLEECFSTGQILSINNSDWILDNQEYNIIYLDPNLMTLSYQGPFWGTIDNSVQSAFFNLAFGDDLEIGDRISLVGASSCIITGKSHNQYEVICGSGSQTTFVDRENAWGWEDIDNPHYDDLPPEQTEVKYFDSPIEVFDIEYYSSINKISILYNEHTGFIDNDDLRLRSSFDTKDVIKQISNPINNLLYILTEKEVYIIDPMTEEVKKKIEFLLPNPRTGFDIVCDTKRGNVYISYTDNTHISQITKDLTFNPTQINISNHYGKMTYNTDDDHIYVFTRDNVDINTSPNKKIFKIDANTLDIDNIISTFTDDIGNDDNFEITTHTQCNINKKGGQIHYNEFTGKTYIGNNGSLHKIDISNNQLDDLGIDTSTYYSIAFDSVNKCMWISNSSNDLIQITEDGTINRYSIGTYGYLMYNEVDSNLYIASRDASRKLHVYSTFINDIIYTFDLDFELDKIVHNKESGTIIGSNWDSTESQNRYAVIPIQFIYNHYKSFSKIFNLSSNEVPISFENTSDNIQYGLLADDYTEPPFMYLKTRDFIRTPRKNYSSDGSPQVTWEIVWDRDDIDEIFMFDISGDHLVDNGSYSYIGTKPLENPTLRREPNSNLDLVDKGYAQKTIFHSISHILDYNDSTTNVSFIPKGFQSFFGFNSKDEGVKASKLLIIEREEINVDFPTYDSFTSSFSTTIPDQYLTFNNNKESGFSEIILNDQSTDTFDRITDLSTLTSKNTNLKEGHLIRVRIKDDSKTNKYVSRNDNMIFRIYRIFQRKLILISVDDRIMIDESTNINGLSLLVNIEVLPKPILEIDFYGQTEVEDIRYKTELTNTGNKVNPEDVFIFREYDINEGGMDWNFLNNKRKEMLMVRNDIFNYIGSYRSIINSINYFGYNDLELYEYFRNIDVDSENYLKLSKVEIPDIFDNSVEGWSENYRKYHFPNKNYEDTNLFNLAYRFTDFEGNNLQTYSLGEAVIKLSGLKKWLENNIIPITHKILDITGRMDFRDDHQIFNTPSSVTTYDMHDYITPVEFDINETYVMPIQNGSTVYNSVIDFKIGSDDPVIDYFTLNIKTYKIYPEWDVFKSYSYLDKVTYYGRVYENVLLDNTPTVTDPNAYKNINNNPRENEDVEVWNSTLRYDEGNIVVYDRRYYKYSYRTENINYPPWDGATGSCISGTPSETNGILDNYYDDLLDRIGSSNDAPNYWVSHGHDKSNFDVLDIIKENYPNDWCLVLDQDEYTIENIIIDLINMPEEQYIGDKPEDREEALKIIHTLIEDYTIIKSSYKLKFADIPPIENLMLDNIDFILWDDITKWLEIDLEPVQTINEYRSGVDMLLPFNFTLDSSIDPYIVVSCRSDNGYGQVKNIKKSYEIKFNADADSVLIKSIR